mmetsp:Transcript_17209/g.22351  ORF Transcript_17209/g.22351 Transcript_17209/m.22351 type:complete len:291 (+) Transcript_17209:237-1109(+)|eukprot:CAMPEP_0116062074 /NCGR_PEP_ID=MMETSP0322-20121206/7505_1 /TAXON_ID=163516 /ORGANISM="Leptocylindrus danicus var. apora, Strain B651" /LENGTH=290 /DNA_ID=CAMNT_0003547237 /DNA_START=209 /DNA_END=1081 /DNA_ORIENTATION=-
MAPNALTLDTPQLPSKAKANANTSPTVQIDAYGTYPNNVTVSKHPCLAHKISIMRSCTTQPSLFRALLREVTYNLAYEATALSDLKLRAVDVSVHGSDETVKGLKLASSVAVVPIMRSGLGMVDAVLELLPQASVHHIGMYTNKFSSGSCDGESMPVQYYNRLPKVCSCDIAYVLDPVIASGNTAVSVVGILKNWGVKRVHVVSVVASDIGLKTLMGRHPDVHVTLGKVDPTEVEESGKFRFVGIGDAGDRQFGTGPDNDIDEDEELVSVHKRKRTMSCGNCSDISNNTK